MSETTVPAFDSLKFSMTIVWDDFHDQLVLLMLLLLFFLMVFSLSLLCLVITIIISTSAILITSHCCQPQTAKAVL